MNENTTYLKVSEMGVETGTPEKTLKVTELPEKKTEQEVRRERVDANVTAIMMNGFTARNATDAIRNILYMEETIGRVFHDYNIYDGWKEVAIFLAGRLSATEKEGY